MPGADKWKFVNLHTDAILMLSVQEDIEDGSLADLLYWLMLMAIRRDWLLRMNRILN